MIIWISFLSIILCYILLSLIYRKFWDRNLEISVSLPSDPIHVGEVAHMKEVILNDKFLPLPILEVYFPLDKGLRYTDDSNTSVTDKTYRRDVFAVGMKRKIHRTFAITGTKRGYYTLTKVEMMSYDLFMQQKFLGALEMFDDFYVYPQRVKNERILPPFRQIVGECMVQKHLLEDPFAFSGLRDYVNTDPMHMVNWAATAKSQSLIVNTLASTNKQNIVILLDTYENIHSFSGQLNEEAISIAAALIERLLLQGMEVSLEGNGIDCVSKERISLSQMQGMNPTLLIQSLTRLDLGKEEDFSLMYQNTSLPIAKDSYVVLISKNQDLEIFIKEHFSQFLWIVPYKYEEPRLPSISGKYYPWKLESGNLE